MPTSQFMVILMLLLQIYCIFANTVLFVKAYESVGVLKSIKKTLLKQFILKTVFWLPLILLC